MQQFRNFLETKGAALSKTTEFLPFYALPFIPDPQQNPAFAAIFQPSWQADLLARFEVFLKMALQTSALPEVAFSLQFLFSLA